VDKRINIKILMPLLVIVLTLLITTSIVVFSQDDILERPLPNFNNISKYIDSNKYTHVDDLRVATNQQELNTDNEIIETDLGRVYLDLESLSFQFETSSGYIWSSTIGYENSGLSNNWKRRARSAIHIESFNTRNSTYALTEEFLLSDNTKSQTTIIENGFESRITFGISRISLLLKVEFTSSGIIAQIPSSEITENDNYKLSSVKVYPFFGAVLEEDIPGYVFVPDGIGALVNYQEADSSIIANYKKEFYNRQIGYNVETNLNNINYGGTRIYAPIFGFVHGVNQNAIFANILSGSEYGMLNLYYSGKITDYTTVFPEFVYRKTYKQPMDKVGNTISLLQNIQNKIDIIIHYSVLAGNDANYVGMAKTYRDYLFSDKNKINALDTSIPLKLDTIGIEKSQGVLFDKTTVMTTFDQFNEMINDLKSKDINNIVASFSGFTPDGVSWSAPRYDKISKKLGSREDLNNLRDNVEELYFVCEFLKASNKASKINRYSDLSKKINDQVYRYEDTTDVKNLLTHRKTEDLFTKTSGLLKDYEINNLALTTFGSLLYADFKNDVYLEDAIELYQTMLVDSDMKIGLYDANSYVWNNLDAYFDFPMYSSQYLQFSDTVPFLAIVLRGRIDLFDSNANFYAYARDELLRLVDFGVYPSFIVTFKSSKELQKTNLEYIYSSSYDNLDESIDTYYSFVNKALKHVIDADIISRQALENGFMKISYDNDIIIIVNYTDQSLSYNDFNVAAKNYIVLNQSNLLLEEGGI